MSGILLHVQKFVRPFDLGSNEDTESVLSIKNNSSIPTFSQFQKSARFIMSCANIGKLMKLNVNNLCGADLISKQW